MFRGGVLGPAALVGSPRAAVSATVTATFSTGGGEGLAVQNIGPQGLTVPDRLVTATFRAVAVTAAVLAGSACLSAPDILLYPPASASEDNRTARAAWTVRRSS